MKVADFGLSEDVYTTGYFRQGKDDHIKLPFKWMAPESMTDSIFNEKTDVVKSANYILLISLLSCHHYAVVVWSYLLGGVQCWEDPLPSN